MIVEATIDPLRSADLLREVDGPTRCGRHRLEPTPGHTPGHQSVWLSSGADDPAAHRRRAGARRPARGARGRVRRRGRPRVAAATRERVFAEARRRGAPLATAHLTEPFVTCPELPGICQERDGSGAPGFVPSSLMNLQPRSFARSAALATAAAALMTAAPSATPPRPRRRTRASSPSGGPSTYDLDRARRRHPDHGRGAWGAQGGSGRRVRASASAGCGAEVHGDRPVTPGPGDHRTSSAASPPTRTPARRLRRRRHGSRRVLRLRCRRRRRLVASPQARPRSSSRAAAAVPPTAASTAATAAAPGRQPGPGRTASAGCPASPPVPRVRSGGCRRRLGRTAATRRTASRASPGPFQGGAGGGRADTYINYGGGGGGGGYYGGAGGGGGSATAPSGPAESAGPAAVAAAPAT